MKTFALRLIQNFALFGLVYSACTCAQASITNPCKDEPSDNLRLLCEAKFEMDASKCSKITNLDLKQHCVLDVKSKQRSITWSVNNKKAGDP